MSKLSQQEFIDIFTREQKAVNMDCSNYSPNYWHALKKSMRWESPMSLGISGVEFKELFAKIADNKVLNAYEFGIASNALERKNMENFPEFSEYTYCEIMVEAQSHANEWNNIMIPIQTQIYQGTIK